MSLERLRTELLPQSLGWTNHLACQILEFNLYNNDKHRHEDEMTNEELLKKYQDTRELAVKQELVMRYVYIVKSRNSIPFVDMNINFVETKFAGKLCCTL